MYFNKLESYEQAYALGFLAADGWVSNNTLGFALKRADRKSVEYIAKILEKEIGYTGIEIVDYEAKLGERKYLASRFTISDRGLIRVLRTYGIVQSKSKYDIDYIGYIPDKFKMVWIIGYFDGDGGASFNRDNKKDLSINFTGSVTCIKSIEKILGIHFRYIIRNYTYTGVAAVVDDVMKFANIYIKYSTHIHVLERKLLMFQEYLRERQEFVERKERERKQREEIQRARQICPQCGRSFMGKGNVCTDCAHSNQQKLVITKEQLEKELKNCNYTQIGKKYGVSANTIKKKAIKLGIGIKINKRTTMPDNRILRAFYDTFSIKEAAIRLNIGEWKVTSVLKEYFGDTYKELLVTGKIIEDSTGKCYKSEMDAALAIGDKNARRHINENLNGTRTSAYGRVYVYSTLERYRQYLSTSDTIAGDTFRELELLITE